MATEFGLSLVDLWTGTPSTLCLGLHVMARGFILATIAFDGLASIEDSANAEILLASGEMFLGYPPCDVKSWNSVLENLSNGVPMLGFPQMAEQNTNLIEDDWTRRWGAQDELKAVVGLVRPVSVAFEVVDGFNLSESEVYTSDTCESSLESVNHAVLAIGYNVDESATLYWIIKNSWSENWGMDGYFNMEMG
ncbi:hypothetical protein L7F22_014839 [Adiantum nelumboides]|nr:hypothetical protein [Adiantum nelumboides]